MAVHLGAHAHDGVDGHGEEPGELRDQVDGVEHAAEDAHGESAHHHAHNGAAAAFAGVVDDAGGEHQRAAGDEVGEVAHEGGGAALHEELEEDLQKLRRHARHGPEIERAQEHRQLAGVQLVEAGGEEEGKVKEHQHRTHGGEHGHQGAAPRPADAAPLPDQQPLQPHRQHHHQRKDPQTFHQKPHIFPGAFQKVSHFSLLLCIKNTRSMAAPGTKRHRYPAVFFHPDYTVGTGVAPVQHPEGRSRTLPPVGNHTPP